jgi:hypothetical protein
MVGGQAEASRMSGVASTLRNTRTWSVGTLVAVMNSLIGAQTRRAKSTVSASTSFSGLAPLGFRS